MFIGVSSEALAPEDVLRTQHHIKKILKVPVGPVLALLPRDYPILETVSSLVPAILAGNSILLKDHPGTPNIANFFEEAVQECAPNLAMSLFVDPTDISYIYQSRAVKYVTFTGTYKVALDVYYELG